MRPIAIGGALCALGLGSLEAQINVSANRWLTSPHVTDYRVSVSTRRLGAVTVTPFGQLTLLGPKGDGSTLGGLGLDLALRVNRQARPYLVGGVSGGLSDIQQPAHLGLWRAWSAGVGAELVSLPFVTAAIEVRYQTVSRGGTGGPSIGLRLGSPFGSRPVKPIDRVVPVVRSEPGTSPTAPPPIADAREARAAAAPPSLATVALAAPEGALTVVEQARGAMGTPYRWGGSDANGFDCSGLIRFAYQALGIALPRRSGDQARHGRPIPLELDQLLPGDILAFSANPGGEVTHVGLYVGAGRFIHSASSGVQESPLGSTESSSRWWLDRWVGARRILP